LRFRRWKFSSTTQDEKLNLLPSSHPVQEPGIERPTEVFQHTHAVMFHHFHDNKHPVGQGSLSADQLRQILDWLSERYSVLSADEYIYRLSKYSLEKTDICLTFDDGLLCQAEVALPILRERNIKAFFFIYSAPFSMELTNNETLVEVYRYFRTTMFETIDDFYLEFLSLVRVSFEVIYSEAEKEYSSEIFLSEFPFYTETDKWFRYLRDRFLGKERYDWIMSIIMRNKHFSIETALTKLWMSNADLVTLNNEGHLVGLHSFSHPTMLHEMSAEGQEYEYKNNLAHLSEILGEDPIAMAHPCGRYNEDTLKILTRLGIEIGFLSNTSVVDIKTKLEVPRRDHANIWAAMQG